jgi:hypothetical protein
MPKTIVEFLRREIDIVDEQITRVERLIDSTDGRQVSLPVLRRLQDQYRELASSLKMAIEIVSDSPQLPSKIPPKSH